MGYGEIHQYCSIKYIVYLKLLLTQRNALSSICFILYGLDLWSDLTKALYNILLIHPFTEQ